MINILELRKKIGYTQVDFAKLLGVSIASLRRWEKGENNPSPLAIERIEYVYEKVNNGLLEELVQEEQQNKRELNSDICKKRKFAFEDKEYEIEYMPYVYNGPEDQLEFYNKLINMQENVKNKQDWKKYSRRLSLVKSAEGELTSQYLLEKPKDSNKSWSADSGAHGWHRYVGRFPAQLVRAIINSFALNEDDVILDPFCGSGTTILEARLLGIPAILSFRALEPVLGVDPYNFGGEVIGSEYLSDDDVSVEKLKVMHKSEVFKDFFYELLNKEEMVKLKSRIFMMMKFFEDMDDLIINFQKCLKPGGKVAFVIGNKKIGDYIIPTDKIITEIFENSGFKYIDVIAHKLKTNNSNSKVPWQDRIIENEFVIFYEKV